MASPQSDNSPSPRTLVSWKEIASYLERAERTVKRWERERGLPVHRVPGGERSGVFAYSDELTAWLKGKSSELENEDPDSAVPASGNVVEEVGYGNPVPLPPLQAAAPGSVRRRSSITTAAAWILPLCLAAGLIIYLSGSRTGLHTPVIGNQVQSNLGSREFPPDSVAVLPFANVGKADGSDYLSQGITESLISNLARIPQLKVRSRDSVFRLKGNDLDTQKAGSELGVSLVVSGRVTVQANNIEVSTEITNVRDNTAIWGKQYTGSVSDLVELQQQISGDIAKELRSSLNPVDTQRVASQGTQNTDAYKLYLKGRYAWYQRNFPNLQTSISYFDQAIIKDPAYALAYSGLADAYSVLPNFGGDPDEDFPKSVAAAQKALELDPTLAHPHAVLGAYMMEYKWDFAAGEAEFRKAFALDPNDATAHQWFAERIGQLGRHQEALSEIKRAHDLDPLSPVIVRVMAGTYSDAGQFDQAIGICSRMVRESPTLAMPHNCLYQAYWGKQMYTETIEEMITEARLDGTPEKVKFSDAMELGLHSSGWKGALADAAKVLEAQRSRGYISAYEIGKLYAGIGDKDRAFFWLNIALRERDRLLLGLNVTPFFESLRTDPRFTELLRKIGLPTSQQALAVAYLTPPPRGTPPTEPSR